MRTLGRWGDMSLMEHQNTTHHQSPAAQMPCLRTFWTEFLAASGLQGHVARGGGVGRTFLEWRDLLWWSREQAKRKGARHGGRFNPNLDVERFLVKTAGLHWKQTAMDRQTWIDLGHEFIQHNDLPWSTGKQLQLQNLQPVQSTKTSTTRLSTQR